jgi:hypothetical protein
LTECDVIMPCESIIAEASSKQGCSFACAGSGGCDCGSMPRTKAVCLAVYFATCTHPDIVGTAFVSIVESVRWFALDGLVP